MTKTKPKNIPEHLVQQALECAIETGRTQEDEKRFALIEALLRDALGQDHGVWRWRVPFPARYQMGGDHRAALCRSEFYRHFL